MAPRFAGRLDPSSKLACVYRRVVTAAGIYEFEMALLANLTPETADEALSLIPSLQVMLDGKVANLQCLTWKCSAVTSAMLYL